MDARLRHEVLAALQAEAKKRRVAYTSLLQTFAVERLLALGYELETDDEDADSALPAEGVTLASPPSAVSGGGVAPDPADPLPAGAPIHVDEEVGVVSVPSGSSRDEVIAPVEGAGDTEDLLKWLEAQK